MFRKMVEKYKIGELDIHISDGNYSSKYPRADEFIDTGIPFIRANNLVDKTVSPKDMYFISQEKHNLLLKGHIKTNDILITTRGNLGTTALVPKSYDDANINAQIVLLRPDPEIIDPRFLVWCFDTEEVQTQIERLQTGTALKQLPVGKVREIQIPLPPIAQQRRIADILNRADAVRRKRKEAIALTEELLRSAFLEMFGDPVANPKGWEVVELGKLAQVTDGTHKTPIYIDPGIPFLSAKNVRAHKIDWENTRFISQVEHESLIRRCYPKRGDVLLTKSGTIGEAAVVNRDIEFSLFESVALLKLNNQLINPIFLATLLNDPQVKSRYGGDIKGVAVKHLHLVDIKRLPVIIPSQEAQGVFLIQTRAIEDQRVKLAQAYKLLECCEFL